MDSLLRGNKKAHMMLLMDVAIVPVILSAIAMMLIGFAWYSPILFGKQWMKLKGYTAKSLKEAQSTMGPKYGLSFAASLVMAYVLGKFIVYLGAVGPIQGMTVALMAWVGFTTTTQLTNWIFSNTKFKLYVIDTGYQLATMLVMGAILGMWA